MICIDPHALESSPTKYIVFPNIAERYEPMFLVADGQNLRFHNNSTQSTSLYRCAYLDAYHFNCGLTCFHRDQFAELMHREGHTYEPETFVTDLNLYRKFFLGRKLLSDDGKPIPYRILLGKGDLNFYGKPAHLLAICPEADADKRIAIIHSVGNAQSVRYCSYRDLEQELQDFNGCISFPAVQPDPCYFNVQLEAYETRFVTTMLHAHDRTRLPALDTQIRQAHTRMQKPASHAVQKNNSLDR